MTAQVHDDIDIPLDEPAVVAEESIDDLLQRVTEQRATSAAQQVIIRPSRPAILAARAATVAAALTGIAIVYGGVAGWYEADHRVLPLLTALAVSWCLVAYVARRRADRIDADYVIAEDI